MGIEARILYGVVELADELKTPKKGVKATLD